MGLVSAGSVHVSGWFRVRIGFALGLFGIDLAWCGFRVGAELVSALRLRVSLARFRDFLVVQNGLGQV